MGSSAQPSGSNSVRSVHFGLLQELVDSLFQDEFDGMDDAQRMTAMALGDTLRLRRLDVILAGEGIGLPEELAEVVNLLPPGDYSRRQLCDQLNSILGAHAWGQVYGTVQ